MILPDAEAALWAQELLGMRKKDAPHLDRIRDYWRGRQPLPVMVPTGVPKEVRRMAEMSRINVVGLPVDVVGQALYVDGYRQERSEKNEPAWESWQANKMDARQIGLHRSALAYGAAYVTVLPGDTAPVMRCRSPRSLTVAYGDDDVWPVYALERKKGLKGLVTWRLFDEEAVYTFGEDPKAKKPGADWAGEWLRTEQHGLGVCPVVRFRNTGDLDEEDEVVGEIAALIPLQDQMDFTTFDLLVAQHYQAFRQRYVMGWTTTSETEKAKASASRLWTFDDPDVKIGEFGQSDLNGYLESRESTLQHLATISQVPPHYLLGKLVNLSAEALAAAEAGQRRKISQRETSFGESWEMVFGLAAGAMGAAVTAGAQVRWRDTEARALASTVDALGKMAQMLSIPPQMLWERIPGWTQQDVERAKAMAAGMPVPPRI